MQKILSNLCWLGTEDRKISLFENEFPVEGMVYNSYLLSGEKSALLDTVDQSGAEEFLNYLQESLDDRNLDYIVVHHMEPDHSATLKRVCELYPTAKVVGNAKTFQLIERFFDLDLSTRKVVVQEGDILDLGGEHLQFMMAPMVHWPEVMVSFNPEHGVLFSADAFGSFGPLNGKLYVEVKDFAEYLLEARRYYVNIVGKYGAPVQLLLRKAANLPIRMVCPLHGRIWSENFEAFLTKYQRWSSYQPEELSVSIQYASIYGHTEQAINYLAQQLIQRSIPVQLCNLTRTHVSWALAQTFCATLIVLAAPTYNNGIYDPMDRLLTAIETHQLTPRGVALIQNGSWNPVAGKLMQARVEKVGWSVITPMVTINSAMKAVTQVALAQMAEKLSNNLK